MQGFPAYPSSTELPTLPSTVTSPPPKPKDPPSTKVEIRPSLPPLSK